MPSERDKAVTARDPVARAELEWHEDPELVGELVEEHIGNGRTCLSIALAQSLHRVLERARAASAMRSRSPAVIALRDALRVYDGLRGAPREVRRATTTEHAVEIMELRERDAAAVEYRFGDVQVMRISERWHVEDLGQNTGEYESFESKAEAIARARNLAKG